MHTLKVLHIMHRYFIARPSFIKSETYGTKYKKQYLYFLDGGGSGTITLKRCLWIYLFPACFLYITFPRRIAKIFMSGVSGYFTKDVGHFLLSWCLLRRGRSTIGHKCAGQDAKCLPGRPISDVWVGISRSNSSARRARTNGWTDATK